MIKIFLDFLKILDKRQKKKLIYLQFLIVIMSLLEVLSIISIYPFVSSLNENSNILTQPVIKNIILLFGSDTNALFVFGIIFVTCFLLSSIFSILTVYKLVMLSQKIGAELSNRLFSFYINQEWGYHIQNTSSTITNKIALEAKRVTGILQSLLSLSAMLVKSVIIVISLLIFDFQITIYSFLVFTFCYMFIFRYFQKKIFENGLNISSQQGSRIKQIKESLGSIRQLILSGKQDYFLNNFTLSSFSLAKSMGINRIIGQLPRYVIEFLAIVLIVILLLILTLFNKFTIEQTLSLVSVFLIAGLRLLPSFQQIYASFASIKGSLPAFNSVKDELILSTKNNNKIMKLTNETILKDTIEINNLSFSYDNLRDKNKFTLKNVNLKIKTNSIVGIIGKTGSGKSTLVDLIIGFLKPKSGNIKLDGKDLSDDETLKKWRNCISYVPQKVFLSDDSILSNICFGLDIGSVDQNLLKKSIEFSNLSNFVENLNDKVNTRIGENGVMISGGQSQRIGIARAIYQDKDILIFDEATNQLDVKTESIILENLKKINKTIIFITHRLNSLKNVDLIINVENNKVSTYSSYEESLKNNSFFKDLENLNK
jgi:ABC-type multidrug transport system fused ATPase/permease subunit